MKAVDFPVDTRVALKYLTSRKGTVIGNKLSDGDEVVAVEWDGGELMKANVNDLVKDKSLEEEFCALIMEKVNEAAIALKEANNLARSKGKSLRNMEWDDSENNITMWPVLNQLETGGWNTSSMGC